MQTNEPTCTVVICTRDRPAELERCLRAVRQIEYSSFEVLVVDNASSKAPVREVADRWCARYVIEPAIGLSRARNLGAHVSASDLIAYLDDDAVPEPQWLAALAREFQEPRTGAVSGRILPLDERPDSIQFLDSGAQRQVLDQSILEWFEKVAFGGLAKGGNMALRASAFKDWPGFDARLGRGGPLRAGEDNFAFFSLVDRGFRVVYTPDAVVRHPGPTTAGELRAHELQALSELGLYIGFLFEETSHRRELVRYVLSRIVGRRGRLHPSREHRLASHLHEVFQVFKGVVLYAQLRLTGKLAI